MEWLASVLGWIRKLIAPNNKSNQNSLSGELSSSGNASPVIQTGKIEGNLNVSINPPNLDPKEDESDTASIDGPSLTDLQLDYLLDISKPRNDGAIPAFIDDQTGREVAVYQDALQVFQDYGLMQYSGDYYKLTSEGWSFADQQWALKILDVLHPNKSIEEKDIAEAVDLDDDQQELNEARRHLEGLDEKGYVSIDKHETGCSAKISEKGITHKTQRPIDWPADSSW